MSVRIYLKDNTDGKVHEYGTNPHDALMVENGALKYINMQNSEGTPTGYSFCTVEGKPPTDDQEHLVDIGGERTGVNCHKCRYKNRHQKCSCCRRNPSLKDCYEPDKKAIKAVKKAVLKK